MKTITWATLAGVGVSWYLLRQSGGNATAIAADAINQAVESGGPIPGTVALEAMVPTLPAGPIKVVALAILDNVTPATALVGENITRGREPDQLVAQAAVADLAQHVEPAAYQLALALANVGPDLVAMRLRQVLPSDAALWPKLAPADVAAAVLATFQTPYATDAETLAYALPVSAVTKTVAAHPDGSTVTTEGVDDADGSRTQVTIQQDPKGVVVHYEVTTSPPSETGRLAPAAVVAAFPVWSGPYRALQHAEGSAEGAVDVIGQMLLGLLP